MRNKSAIKENFNNIPDYKTTHVVYTLSHPITKNVFYVGATQKELNVRLNSHIIAAYNEPGSWYKHGFIRDLVNSGNLPIIESVETIVCNSFDEYLEIPKIEAFWISQFESWGFTLINTQHLTDRKKVMNNRIRYKKLV